MPGHHILEKPSLAYMASVDTTAGGVNNYMVTSSVPGSSVVQYEYQFLDLSGNPIGTSFVLYQDSIVTEPLHPANPDETSYSFSLPVPSDPVDDDYVIDPMKTIAVRIWKTDMKVTEWSTPLRFFNPPLQPEIIESFTLDYSDNSKELCLMVGMESTIYSDLSKFKYIVAYNYTDVSENTVWEVSDLVEGIEIKQFPNGISLTLPLDSDVSTLQVGVYTVYEFQVQGVSDEIINFYTVSQVSDTSQVSGATLDDFKPSVKAITNVDVGLNNDNVQSISSSNSTSLYDIGTQNIAIKWDPPAIACTIAYPVLSYQIHRMVNDVDTIIQTLTPTNDPLHFNNQFILLPPSLSGIDANENVKFNVIATYASPTDPAEGTQIVVEQYMKPLAVKSLSVSRSDLVRVPNAPLGGNVDVSFSFSTQKDESYYTPKIYWNIMKYDTNTNEAIQVFTSGVLIPETTSIQERGGNHPQLKPKSYVVSSRFPINYTSFEQGKLEHKEFEYDVNVWVAGSTIPFSIYVDPALETTLSPEVPNGWNDTKQEILLANDPVIFNVTSTETNLSFYVASETNLTKGAVKHIRDIDHIDVFKLPHPSSNWYFTEPPAEGVPEELNAILPWDWKDGDKLYNVQVAWTDLLPTDANGDQIVPQSFILTVGDQVRQSSIYKSYLPVTIPGIQNWCDLYGSCSGELDASTQEWKDWSSQNPAAVISRDGTQLEPPPPPQNSQPGTERYLKVTNDLNALKIESL